LKQNHDYDRILEDSPFDGKTSNAAKMPPRHTKRLLGGSGCLRHLLADWIAAFSAAKMASEAA
jgi:hypothetical protein